MKRILDEFDQECSNYVETRFVDVWQNSDVGKQYGIRVVPTLIFLDPSGEELYRQEGVMTKPQLVSKWKELGYGLDERKGQAE